MNTTKMSAVFHKGYIEADFNNGSILENGYPIFVGGCGYKAKAIVLAVNCYDELVEDNKLLRDTLLHIVMKVEMIGGFPDKGLLKEARSLISKLSEEN